MKGSAEVKKRRIAAIIAAALALCLIGVGALALKLGDKVEASEDVSKVDPGRSQVLVTGMNYRLDKKQEQELEKVEKIKQNERSEEEVEDEDYEDFEFEDDLLPDGEVTGGQEIKPESKKKKDNNSSKKEERKKPEKKNNRKQSDEGEVDPNAPIIYTDLKEGEVIGGEVLSFYVSAVAKNGTGRSIPYTNFTVKLNNAILYDSGTKDGKTIYSSIIGDGSPAPRIGENVIDITVKDSEGNVGHVVRKITMDPTKEAKYAGTATIGVTAGVLGIDTIVPDGDVRINKGENLAVVIARYFGNSKVQIEHTGSRSLNYYLSRVYKTGIIDSIPAEKMEGLSYKGSNRNSLGAGDFGNESGWKITINGEEPSVGMSGITPKDGDVIEVWYTLTAQ